MEIATVEFWNDILVWFLGLVGTVVTGILIPFVTNWLKSKTDNANLQYVIDELSQTVQTSVNHVNQTFVNQLKADGKFDADNQAKALKMAVEESVNSLTAKTVKILGKEGIDIETLIIKYIEAAIAEKKTN
nr:MAG TPA: holin [Caudoviricetes sp.]